MLSLKGSGVLILIILIFVAILSTGCDDNLGMNEFTTDRTAESTNYANLGLDNSTVNCESIDSIDQLIAETSLMFFDSLWIDVSHPNFLNFNDSMDVFMAYIGGQVSINYSEFIHEFSAHFNVSEIVVNEYFTIMGENYSYLSNLSSEQYENLLFAISCVPKGINSESSVNESEERLVRWALARWGGSWGSDCHGQIVGGVIDAAIYGAATAVGGGLLTGAGLVMAVSDTADAICECTGEC